MKKKLKNNNEGILFWVTGLSGSGKSTIAKNIFYKIKKIYGPTLLIHGDNLRNIFKLNGYSLNERLMIGKMYIDLINLIIKQKINVIFTVNGLFHSLRNINKKKFKNYFVIYIKADLKKILKEKKKRNVYSKKNVWGVDLYPEFPKNPHIIIKNNFKNNLNFLSQKILKDVIKII